MEILPLLRQVFYPHYGLPTDVPPVKVMLWGLFPTYYNMCRFGRHPWDALAGDEFMDRVQEEQVSAYPPEILENMRKASAMAELIAMEFGPKVYVTVVAADSFAGVGLCLKHRLRGDLNLIVDGNVVPLSRDLGELRSDYDIVRGYVEKAVQAVESKPLT